MLSVGLGLVLAVIVCNVLVGPIDSQPGWAVPAVVALAVTVGVGAVARSSYRQSAGIRWWHLLVMALGAGVFLNALSILTDGGVVGVLSVLVNIAGIIAIVVGGIIAIVQASTRPDTAPTGALVAPIVGYTADGQPVYGTAIRSQTTNVFAVLALVFGILGGLLALIFGYIALSQIRRTGENGRGMAIAGITLGYLYLAFGLIFLVAVASS